jgi:hypothetical protein
MIGRQANEIGQLRKKLQELESHKSAPSNGEQVEDSEPYYEKIVKASEDDLAQLLMKEAASRDEHLDPVFAKQQARTIKATAKIQLDIVRDKLAPIQKLTEEIENKRIVAERDAAWYSEHPEHTKRQGAMKQFIDSCYPDGLAIKNEVGQVVGWKADPYTVAHLAYEYAGRVSTNAQQAVSTAENQRIAAGRSLNAATQGTVPSKTTQPKGKTDAIHAEVDRVFEQISPALQRSR